MHCLPFHSKWKRTCTLATYLSFVLFFTAAAGAVFMLLEHRESSRLMEKHIKRCLCEKDRTINLIETAWNNSSLNSSTIKDAIENFDKCHRNYDTTTEPRIFNYFCSVIYAISVHSTVGYGQLVPSTVLGRLATLVYGVLGIPLYMAMSIELSEWLDDAYVCLANLLHKLFHRSFRKSKLDVEEQSVEVPDEREGTASAGIQVIIIIAALAIYMSVMPGVVLLAEGNVNWSYISSLHFVFTSISLIGFGDLMVTQTNYLTFMFPILFIGQIMLTVLNIRFILCIRHYLTTKEEAAKENETPAEPAKTGMKAPTDKKDQTDAKKPLIAVL